MAVQLDETANLLMSDGSNRASLCFNSTFVCFERDFNLTPGSAQNVTGLSHQPLEPV